jgi:transcriptional regulator with XRE-family HTH domain
MIVVERGRMTTSSSFGRWLKQRRKALDLTQEDLARQVGCSVWMVLKIEADTRRPSRQLVERLLQCLELTPDERQWIVRWARAVPGRVGEFLNGAAVAIRAPTDAGSPFIVGPPIQRPCHFYGRTFELTRIFALWRQFPLQNIAIVGARRSGKTSLLRCLMALAVADSAQLRPDQRADWLPCSQRYRLVFVDFQDARMHRRERLLRHILAGLGLVVPERCDLEQFMDIVSQQLHSPALLLLDEPGAGLASPELDLAFWESLRSLASHYTGGNLGFALAVHEPPAILASAQSKPSSFFNSFGHTFTLGPLADSEARALIASAPVPFDPLDIEWIMAQSGRWPCLLQVLCHARLAALHESVHNSAWRQYGLCQLAYMRHLLEEG